jgi:hypothetical protein
MTQDLARLVEQYQAFCMKDPRRQSPWRQCEFALRLIIPTLLHRETPKADPGPVSVPPRLFDFACDVASTRDLGAELPVPTWLFGALSAQQLRQVVSDVGEEPSRVLTDLQHAYYRANLRYIDLDPSRFPHEFVAAMLELPERIRSRVLLLLLYVHDQEEAKKELLAVTGARRMRQRHQAHSIARIESDLQDIATQLNLLDRIHGLRIGTHADVLLVLRYVRGAVAALDHTHGRHLPPTPLPKRAFDFSRTQRRALLALKQLLKSTGETDWHIVASMIRWLRMLGPWRAGMNKEDLPSVVKALSHNLKNWGDAHD